MYAQVEKPKENSFPTKRQESRAVANTVTQKKSGVKQGFGFVDNRPEAIAQRKLLMKMHKTPQGSQYEGGDQKINHSSKGFVSSEMIQRKIDHGISLVDIKGYPTLKNYEERVLEARFNAVSNHLDSRKNKLWNEDDDGNMNHTLGTMVDLKGSVYDGHSTYANDDEYQENLKIKGDEQEGTWNLETLCAEQYILNTSGGENRYIFSVAKDGYGYKYACSKCASGEVLGAHNIVDAASDDAVEHFVTAYHLIELFETQDAYLKAYWKDYPGKKEEFVENYIVENSTEPKPLKKVIRKSRARHPYYIQQKNLPKEANNAYQVAYDAWVENRPTRQTFI